MRFLAKSPPQITVITVDDWKKFQGIVRKRYKNTMLLDRVAILKDSRHQNFKPPRMYTMEVSNSASGTLDERSAR